MKLIDRIDWMAYRQMLDKAIAEEKPATIQGIVYEKMIREDITNLKYEQALIDAGRQQELLDRYEAELGEDIEDFFKGFYKN